MQVPILVLIFLHCFLQVVVCNNEHHNEREDNYEDNYESGSSYGYGYGNSYVHRYGSNYGIDQPTCGKTCSIDAPICDSERDHLPCTCSLRSVPDGCLMRDCQAGDELFPWFACYCTPGFTGMCYDSGCSDYPFTAQVKEYGYGTPGYQTTCKVGMCNSQPPSCTKNSYPLQDYIPCTCEPGASPQGCRMRPCIRGDTYTAADPFQCTCSKENVGCWNDRCTDKTQF